MNSVKLPLDKFRIINNISLMSQKIIIYHSQTEQNMDEFIQMLFGLFVSHPVIVCIAIGLPILFLCLINATKKRY